MLATIENPQMVKRSKQLPFRFLSAYKELENIGGSRVFDALENAVEASIENMPKLEGTTVIAVDTSGSISVATGGMLKRHLKPETLENLLRNELLPQDELGEDKQKFNLSGILNLIRAKQNGGADDE